MVWWMAAFLWVCLAPAACSRLGCHRRACCRWCPAGWRWCTSRSTTNSTHWVLFTLALVWAADTGAFFAGRWLGRVPLAPRVSPRKTWEGVLGGMVTSALVAWVAASWYFRVDVWLFVATCVAVAAVSIVGDLTESMLKRFVGLKDSGSAVPRPWRHAGSHRQRHRGGAGAGVRAARPAGHSVSSMDDRRRRARIHRLGGRSTLDVLARHPDRFRVVALGAHRNVAQARRAVRCASAAPYAALADARRRPRAERRAARARAPRRACSPVPGALEELAALPEVAQRHGGHCRGRRAALHAGRGARRQAPAARQQGIAGDGRAAADADGARSAAPRCCPSTASTTRSSSACRATRMSRRRAAGREAHPAHRLGRPVPRLPTRALEQVTPDQACAHPNWVMGRKISVDSATLMNKGLELIEACLLFGLPPAARRGA